jgi:hypothetical protein
MAKCLYCNRAALPNKVLCKEHIHGADPKKGRIKHGYHVSDLSIIIGPALLILFFLLAPLISKAQGETFTYKAEIGAEVYEFKVYGDGESLIGAEYTIKVRGVIVEKGFGTSPKDNFYVKTEDGVLTKDGILSYRNIGRLDFYYACIPISSKK